MNTNAQLVEALTHCQEYQECEHAYTEATGQPVTLRSVKNRQLRLHGKRKVIPFCVMNLTLSREFTQRKAAEEKLKNSERQYTQLLERSEHLQAQLRRLSHQVLAAQEEERKRISRELHDVIAQSLTSINLRLAVLKKEAAHDTGGLERSIAQTQELVAHSVDIVHRFARELRPTMLDDLGLIPALHTFMNGFKKETGIHVSLSAFAAVERVKGDIRTVLYRVAQEALTNIARHAHASRAEVTIQKLDGAICMRITDNGKGFPVERVLHAKRNKRLGLLGMNERLEMVNGKATIESAPGKGTTIQAQIPLAAVRAVGRAENSLMESADASV